MHLNFCRRFRGLEFLCRFYPWAYARDYILPPSSMARGLVAFTADDNYDLLGPAAFTQKLGSLDLLRLKRYR
jgi:hypothetical protein